MLREKVWRYYCEHCPKSGCSGGHIKNHERGCTENPGRECGVCRLAKLEQVPMELLIAALRALGLTELRSLAQGCPACMLAAIIQDRRQRGFKRGKAMPEVEYERYAAFNYREERTSWWASHSEDTY